jgi:hypothetical protein
MIVKAAFDPGWGHYELFGIVGFAHETVYPGVTQNSVKYGGIADNEGFAGAAPGTAVVAKSSTAGYYVDDTTVGGFGASLRVPVIKDKLTFGAKGLYGPGVGRYGDTTLSDVTNDANGDLKPIHNGSACSPLKPRPPRACFSTSTTAATTRRAPTTQPRPSRLEILRPPSARPV